MSHFNPQSHINKASHCLVSATCLLYTATLLNDTKMYLFVFVSFSNTFAMLEGMAESRKTVNGHGVLCIFLALSQILDFTMQARKLQEFIWTYLCETVVATPALSCAALLEISCHLVKLHRNAASECLYRLYVCCALYYQWFSVWWRNVCCDYLHMQSCSESATACFSHFMVCFVISVTVWHFTRQTRKTLRNQFFLPFSD